MHQEIVMPGSQVVDNVIKPEPEESAGIEALREQLDAAFAVGYRPVLVGPGGEHVELTESAFKALLYVAHGMSAGMTMTLVPSGKQLTTQQAAEMLHVSRPHLIKLLDRGDIPFEKVGTHRRLRIEDVLAYREAQSRRRRDQLAEITRLSQEFEGVYR
jgi:excisionase family DNA binding protein